MNYGLLGEKLSHSFSKDIHNRIGGYSYELIEVAPGNLKKFMEDRRFKGINVTIPYKQEVIPHLTYIDENAKAIGAVNTVINREGLLCGYNTDFGGMKALLKKNGIEVCGKKTLILGTGGTSKTARAVLSSLGADEIYRVSRGGNEDAISYDEAYSAHADADIIINTTPCGMYPDNYSVPIDISAFKNLSAVVDAIYNPLASSLVLNARKMGITAVGGLYMLVAQAVLAAEYFTEVNYGESVIDSIYSEILREKQNLVLVGMPGSGKTTVGKIAARYLSMEFVDTDNLIEKEFKMPITEIFRKFGQEKFRESECEIIKSVSKTGGKVISTGGGVVLREENVDALRSNGRIFFINRPLCDLIPTKSRPLADSKDKITELYNERYPIYLAASDEKIDVVSDAKSTAKLIESRWNV